MNFFFKRKSKISLVFAISKVYCTCVLEVCDFFHKSSAFFANRGQMEGPVLGRSAIAISSELISWK